jgi:hypothetical protein
MENVIQQMAEFLDGRGWKFTVEQDKPLLQTVANGKTGRWHCVAIGGSDNEHLIFLSLLPVDAPPEKRVAVSELLTRINYQLAHGCYEMGFDDGEIRFRTSIPVISGQVQSEMLEYLVFANLCAFDNNFGAIMQVLYGECSAKAALEGPCKKKRSKPRFELN